MILEVDDEIIKRIGYSLDRKEFNYNEFLDILKGIEKIEGKMPFYTYNKFIYKGKK